MTRPEDRVTWQESDHVLARIAVQPVTRFMRVEAAGGLALVAAALVGLIWVNLADASYHSFWGTHLSVDLSIVHLDLTLTEWVNDLLMAFFFLVVSLEIKREFAHGELSDRRRAALPVISAVGGMIVPVAIYVGFNMRRGDGDRWLGDSGRHGYRLRPRGSIALGQARPALAEDLLACSGGCRRCGGHRCDRCLLYRGH